GGTIRRRFALTPPSLQPIMPPFAVRPWLRSLPLLLALLASDPPSAAQEPQFELIATRLLENNLPIALELVVYRPVGEGPFPTVMFNHGSTGLGNDPAEFVKTWHSPTLAAFFNAQGWLVVFPQRRGRGKSGGLYDEG